MPVVGIKTRYFDLENEAKLWGGLKPSMPDVRHRTGAARLLTQPSDAVSCVAGAKPHKLASVLC